RVRVELRARVAARAPDEEPGPEREREAEDDDGDAEEGRAALRERGAGEHERRAPNAAVTRGHRAPDERKAEAARARHEDARVRHEGQELDVREARGDPGRADGVHFSVKTLPKNENHEAVSAAT